MGTVLVWIVSMSPGRADDPAGRWRSYAQGSRPWGGRWLSATVVTLVVLGALGWSARHPSGACGCGPQVSFGRAQPGFRRLGGPVGAAVARLPVPVRLAPAAGAPEAVYRSGGMALVLYGHQSPLGVFRFTARRRPAGFGPRSLRALVLGCDVCSDNRLVRLAAGVRGAVLVGGNGPNSVTWLQRGLQMQVMGPGATFSDHRAIAAARAIARANRR
jgi:hypothetical protein